jgi:hypothetical protein
VRGLDISFIRKVYPVGAALAILGFLSALRFADVSLAVGILFGGIFGIINMMLLSRLIVAVLHPGPNDPVEIGVTFLVKFPILIGILVLVLWRHWIDPVGFAIGFPMILLAGLLAAIYHFYFGEGQRSPEEGSAR